MTAPLPNPLPNPPRRDSLPPTAPPAPASASDHHDHAHEEMVCYCFHVPLHKIENFIRRERPKKISMISHCLGAGTGCGTCVWDIKDIYKRVMAECAVEDAAKGIVAPPATSSNTTPLPTPYAPLPKITGRQPVNGTTPRLHSPAVDLGPVFAPIPVPTPLPLTAPPDPRFPVSAESIELEFEPEPDAPAPAPTPAPATNLNATTKPVPPPPEGTP